MTFSCDLIDCTCLISFSVSYKDLRGCLIIPVIYGVWLFEVRFDTCAVEDVTTGHDYHFTKQLFSFSLISSRKQGCKKTKSDFLLSPWLLFPKRLELCLLLAESVHETECFQAERHLLPTIMTMQGVKRDQVPRTPRLTISVKPLELDRSVSRV